MWLLIGLYIAAALLLAFYTSGQLLLLLSYLRHRSTTPALPPFLIYPTVTVQLPLYNEQQVVERLLAAVAALDYPPEQLCIQILDDSTDETAAVVAAAVAFWQAQGMNMVQIRRAERSGYKAGALAYGLAHTTSEFIAIFDADFIPPPDFLRRTLPYLLAEARLGVVQTSWGHLNADENALTRAQRLAIDGHFVIEQAARSRMGWFVPFNGTGGVWRTACIQDAGGWSDETLTEDLDLSYRAQLRGWRSLYLPDIIVAGELPPQFAAYRQQQRRWAMGSMQCLRKLGGAVVQAPFSPLKRLMGLHHLCQYLPQPFMLLLLLLTPLLLLSGQMTQLSFLAPLSLLGLTPPLMYAFSQQTRYPQAWHKHLLAFPLLLLLATGLSWSNTYAVLTAYRPHTPFERTPKFAAGWQASPYALRAWRVPLELGWMLYALWGAGLAAQMMPALLPYLLIYAASFGAVVVWEISDWWAVRHVKKTSNLAENATSVVTTLPTVEH